MSDALWPVCGHDRAIALLAHELAVGSVRHSYLISGPRHSGKLTLAMAFARAIVCSNRSNAGAACSECDSCRRTGKGIHPDLQVFSLESQRQDAKERTAGDRLSVETAREISASAAYRPFSAGRRVIIVEDAETMTGIAQEALLKTLEEPPPYLVLILLADSVESLKSTIRSRCEHVNLLPVASDAIAQCLRDRGLDNDMAGSISNQASGLPGWAITMASDLSSLASQRELLERAVEWVAGSPFQRVSRSFELATDLGKQREQVFSELEAVSKLWRSVMMNSAGVMSPVAEPLVAELAYQQFESFELHESLRALESVITCMSDLDCNVRPRLALQAMVMQWPMNSRQGSR
ncbi:DNA polymerase III subunit delta' [soil metagenome]